MKKIVALFSILMVAVCTFCLTACSSYGSLKKAFEKAGYVELELSDAEKENTQKNYEDQDYAIEFHILGQEGTIIKVVPQVLVLEFKSTEEIKNYIKDNNTAQGLIKDLAENEDIKAVYDKLTEAGYVKGNCLIIPLIANPTTITDIVKGA